ncbi:MAG: endonuclease, partial [Pedobacter sp.]
LSIAFFCLFNFQYGRAQSLLKVMSYNIHHANPPAQPGVIDLEAIANVIKKQSPDLVALQEIDVNTKRNGGIDQANKLAELTGMHAYFSKGIDFEGGEYGIAILSKFKILGTERFPLPFQEGLKAEQRSLAVIKVQVGNGKQLYFACTHLDLKDEHRFLQVAEINKILANRKLPVIIAGDFNFTPENPAMKIMEEHFTRSCTSNCAPTIPDVMPSSEIDFIFLKKGSQLKVKSHDVLNDIHASDHLPLVATFLF